MDATGRYRAACHSCGDLARAWLREPFDELCLAPVGFQCIPRARHYELVGVTVGMSFLQGYSLWPGRRRQGSWALGRFVGSRLATHVSHDRAPPLPLPAGSMKAWPQDIVGSEWDT